MSEPARDVPVYGSCDVLVVGGGPAGTAAAVAAARVGADVVLMERYGCLGGLSTAGLVTWIDRMTDWEGRAVVAGVGQELLDRCGAEGVSGPPRELWGSRDPDAVAYWSVRNCGQRGIIQWAPSIDPERLKCAPNDAVRDAGVHMLFHCWAVAAVHERGCARGVIFESKEGRKALLAGAVIDCSGDGDIFAAAGAAFDNDIDPEAQNAKLNTAFRFGNVDMKRYLDFKMRQADAHGELLRRAAAEGLPTRPTVTPNDSIAVFMAPRFAGYSALSVADLTAVEFRSRDAMLKTLAWFRANMPGFERACLLDTASQIGTRHSRRLEGITRVTIDHWRDGGRCDDSIGLCPGLTPQFPTLQIPYGCLVPRHVDGLLAAGRNLSADPAAHGALREVPECWVMGQGAGVAAAIASRDSIRLRDVPVAELQHTLERQGAPVSPPV